MMIWRAQMMVWTRAPRNRILKGLHHLTQILAKQEQKAQSSSMSRVEPYPLQTTRETRSHKGDNLQVW